MKTRTQIFSATFDIVEEEGDEVDELSDAGGFKH
jgi:hypothetical protein